VSNAPNSSGSPLNDWEIDLDDDSPSDTTVRPARPEIIEYLEKQRERTRRWQEEQKTSQSPPDKGAEHAT
jgi:hypothetical protein